MKWIPVNEKLPDCDDKWGISKIVLCLDARGRVGFGIYQNGEKQLYHAGWFTGGGVGEDSVTVTHWMPLPEPPKEECNIVYPFSERGGKVSDLISRKAVEKIIKEFFKTKVDEIPKREKFNKLCDLCDLYLELNADLHKEIEDIPVAYDAVSDEDNYVIDTEKAIEIVKGAIKDEEEEVQIL